MLGTLLMSLVARMPLAIAPAMGVNAYFSCEYTIEASVVPLSVKYS